MRSSALLLVSCLALACAPKHVEPSHGHAHHRFEHAEEWAARFEDPSRDAWQKPDEVIAALGLPKNASLADLGSATGYFSVRFARALPEGLVYGVDVESSMVDYLKARAEKEELKNLKVVLAAFDDAKLPEPVDCILIVNTIHHIQERPAYFTKLAASLKPGGRLAIIDFKKGSKRGPPDAEKLTVEQVTAELAEAGLVPQSSWAFLPDQYFVTFGKAAKVSTRW
ncbi:MAG: class I SAM-dependent methyltransferase [Myxococcaceae bacterium]|jgi:ubiquinone/menaquinone biosynthesis C-methylase UbiE|nr:class I SAM-dependent methyltransferase [Myxococcaceae bacterium]